jgi:4-alpha-glucanotransferase
VSRQLLPAGLVQLCRLYGVQTSYVGLDRRRHFAARETLLHILRQLGAELESSGGVPTALEARRRALAARIIEPVIVAWDGRLDKLDIRLPANRAGAGVLAAVQLEDGREFYASRLRLQLTLAGRSRPRAGDVALLKASLDIRPLPHGCHTLRIATGAGDARALVISAPMTCQPLPDAAGPRGLSWSLFAPVYAIRDGRRTPAGDFASLVSLARWARSQGADAIATLPLLASYLDTPFEPSPYSPVSRLFWNELFIDTGTPGRRTAPERSDGPQPLVDYRAAYRQKRRQIERYLARPGALSQLEVDAVQRADPELARYARFRAAVERTGQGWTAWPEQMRSGRLAARDCPADAVKFHTAAQVLADRQLSGLSERARNGDSAGLYLDLPVGVHRDGYDTWRWPGIFAPAASAGAPPDAFSTAGQDWGFQPFHPEQMRADGYRYFRSFLGRHMRHAAVVRLDHAMGLHRMWWVPQGEPATAGAYVTYPAEELYAVLCVESRRYGVPVIGEDMGTVPPAVRPAMRRHGVYGMYCLYFDSQVEQGGAFRPPSRRQAACVNTHDLPSFAAYCRGADIADRRALGSVAAAESDRQVSQRKAAVARLAHAMGVPRGPRLLDRVLTALARSPSPMLQVNMEDLWGEESPQNVPGTTAERPNWRRRWRVTLPEIATSDEITALLAAVKLARESRGHQRPTR